MLIENVSAKNFNILSDLKRVVSLVPSLTETIAELGAADRLTGVTRFCKYPEDIRQKTTVVGGTKDFDVGKIIGLKPDVVVAVKEENDKKLILALAEKLPVALFNINTPEDAYDMIRVLGKLTGSEKKAEEIISEIRRNFDALPEITARPKCLYLIWENPWMAAGKETFINEMLLRAGFENMAEGRYPELTEKEWAQADVILLSSEPYSFREKHRQALQEQFPGKKVLLVDGELFSWYGSRMRKAGPYFMELRKRVF
jgi:ABC-type Fe3+-hydroxamate transport system substrate-binding protein